MVINIMESISAQYDRLAVMVLVLIVSKRFHWFYFLDTGPYYRA